MAERRKQWLPAPMICYIDNVASKALIVKMLHICFIDDFVCNVCFINLLKRKLPLVDVDQHGDLLTLI